MAVEFKYNKTSLQQLARQLRIREAALPTLKSKEAALRVEVKKAKDTAEQYQREMDTLRSSISSMQSLWAELPDDILRLEHAGYRSRSLAGVRIPVLSELKFLEKPVSLYSTPPWFPEGTVILKELTRLSLQQEVHLRSMSILDHARKKTSQKVNLYEKVQIPEYQAAISKIKRYLEDEDNLNKSAQKILKRRKEEKEKQKAA